MGSSVNKVILLGHLGADPELRQTNAATPVCNLAVATNRHWSDPQGQKHEEVSWHRVVVWGRQAELCQQYLRKGRQVYVEGRLRSASYTDKQGTKRQVSEVVSDSVLFLAARGADERGADERRPDERSSDRRGADDPPWLSGAEH
ncbi:MAG: single-stranded DNA-binding protein [Proteobacteria bacterium]|nr:single-stranded DNA-binding protein [Pseudomonadota bacterium]